MINKEGIIPKAWGSETIFFNRGDYCLKALNFDKAGNDFSMHFHRYKVESWLVTAGSFNLDWIDTKDAKTHRVVLSIGDKWTNESLVPHKLTALEDNSVILEVSTVDDAEDNYRVEQGMSQRT